MAQQHGIVEDDAFQKIGSAGFIIGAILYLIGRLLLSHAANPSNLQERLKTALRSSATGIWTARRAWEQAIVENKGAQMKKIMKWAGVVLGGLVGLAMLMVIGLLLLPADDPSHFGSHPNSAADYTDAVQRVERLRAAEVGFNPDCHTILLTHGTKTAKAIIFVDGYGSCPASFKEFGTQFYDRGYNVLVAPLPRNGLADRMTTEQAQLRAEDLVRYTDEVVDIGRGLGDHLTLAGISAGGLMTGWAAQQRQDVDQAVLISPGFGFAVVPGRLTPLFSRAIIRLPNWFIWNDPELKADAPPDHNYPRVSTRALGQILRLSLATQALVRQKAPGARSILVVLNLNDRDVDNVVTRRVADQWRARGAADVQTYQFPAELHLPHGLIDPAEPDQNIAVVYPKLLELIDR